MKLALMGNDAQVNQAVQAMISESNRIGFHLQGIWPGICIINTDDVKQAVN